MTTARYAVLACEFGLRLSEILELSPRQINDFYFHKRNEDGSIDIPKAAAAEENTLARLQLLRELIKAGFVKATEADAAKLEEMERGLGGGAK